MCGSSSSISFIGSFDLASLHELWSSFFVIFIAMHTFYFSNVKELCKGWFYTIVLCFRRIPFWALFSSFLEILLSFLIWVHLTDFFVEVLLRFLLWPSIDECTSRIESRSDAFWISMEPFVITARSNVNHDILTVFTRSFDWSAISDRTELLLRSSIANWSFGSDGSAMSNWTPAEVIVIFILVVSWSRRFFASFYPVCVIIFRLSERWHLFVISLSMRRKSSVTLSVIVSILKVFLN